MDDFGFHAVIGLFDENTQKIFHEHWNQLSEKNLESKVKSDSSPPHITFAAYEGLTDEMLLAWVDTFCRNECQLPIYFNHIGSFINQAVFLAPRVTEELLAFHKRYHSRLEENHGKIGWFYTPSSGEWVPHATIMHNTPEENKDAMPLLMDRFKPFKSIITALAVYKFYPACEVAVFPLKKIP